MFASEPMTRTLELACQVARSDVPLLITGPNGAGKERIAAIVHAHSSVQRGPLVVVNCGALRGDLIEAELLGAEAGAFTGANKAREGRFEAADRASLSEGAREALLAHAWPGNVRELKNAIEQAALLAGGAAIVAHQLGLPASMTMSTDRSLGLSRRALYRRMDRYGLAGPP